jgi:(R,R)-butanediol dehydrogenase / meso-butanediol dehydrogenase / diacetyl reductase
MGAGPIGLATIVWAKAKGATVVVSEIAPGRAELARALGADVVINPNECNPADRVRELAGHNPDLVFECIGVRGTLGKAVHMLGLRGLAVVVGVCMEPDQITPVECVFKEVTVRFVLGYTRQEFEATIAALSAGRIRPQAMVTDVITIERVPEMFAALRNPGTHAKALIEFAG